MRIVLFDIDGTLQSSPGVGRLAFRRTLATLLGDGAAADTVPFSGRVDWAIWRELLAGHGHTPDEVDAQLSDYFRHYLAELVRVLEEPGTPKPALLPGVLSLLDRLSRDEGVLLGLVTGNIESAAWLKLGYTGIAHFFCFGAFGNDAWERNVLPALALERASRYAGGRMLTGADAVVIGDTVHDIACARAAGARAIAVATGTDREETLTNAGAYAVLPSLEECERVLELIYQE